MNSNGPTGGNTEKKSTLREALKSYGRRTVAFAAAAFIINVAFAAFNGAVGIIYRSIWYGSLAGYYVLLSVQRLGVLLSNFLVKKKSDGDDNKLLSERWKIYLINGVIMLVLVIALSVAVTQMVTSDKPHRAGTITAITIAAYTFYKMTLAIINLTKAKKLKEPLIQTLRNISFVDALVTMLSLAVTLISTFGEVSSMRTLLCMLGAAVCLTSISLGIYMIVNGVKILKSGGNKP